METGELLIALHRGMSTWVRAAVVVLAAWFPHIEAFMKDQALCEILSLRAIVTTPSYGRDGIPVSPVVMWRLALCRVH